MDLAGSDGATWATVRYDERDASEWLMAAVRLMPSADARMCAGTGDPQPDPLLGPVWRQ